MDFDEWHHKQLNGDADNCPHEAWERKAWDSACEMAALLAEATAAGRDAEAIAEAILGMRSAQAIARSNVMCTPSGASLRTTG